MNKVFMAALAGALALSGNALAADNNTSNDIQSDINAVDKDNAAIQKHKGDLAHHRNEKAVDKTNGNYGSQAVDSAKIGADKTAITEKKMEKNADQKILKHHEHENNEDNLNSTGRQ